MKEKVRSLTHQLEDAVATLEKQRKAKWSIPTAGKQRRIKGAYSRVAIPDTHGSKADKKAVAAMLRDLEVIQPKQVVLLGDHIDCGGFLAQHHTLGYVAEIAYSWEDDVEATNTLLDRVQAAVPDAEIRYLYGNHEMRVERWIVTQTLRHQKDANYLMRMMSPASVLSLEDRGIQHHETGRTYDGLHVRGTIRLGNCHFTHGSRTGKYATKNTLQDFGANVVHGHTHQSAFASMVSVHQGLVGGWSPGCLCELVPLWGHPSNPTQWSHGYGLQLVRPNEDFLHINVPIIDGKSYLVELEKAAATR